MFRFSGGLNSEYADKNSIASNTCWTPARDEVGRTFIKKKIATAQSGKWDPRARGSGGCNFPSGVQERSPVGGLGDFVH